MKKIVNSPKAPSPVGPYNHSVRAGNLLFISGQICIDSQTNSMNNSTIEAETHQVMKNIGYILSEAELTFENIVKCSVFVTDMNLYSKINDVYTTYFNELYAPARELVEVSALPKYVNIEISCIAYYDEK